MNKLMNKYTLKTIIVGDQHIGKSNILMKLCNDKFINNSCPTIGIDFYSKLFNIDNIKLRFHIWDTSGQYFYKSLINEYSKNTDIVLICYDVGDRDTFNNVINYYNNIKDYNIDRKLIYIIGNKIDLDYNEVSIYELEELAEKLKVNYFQISAKENINIDELFIEICNNFLNSTIKKIKNDSIILTDTEQHSNKKNCFCL